MRSRSIDLIPELEYKRLLLKIAPTRILMLSEYKGKFQHRFRSESKRYIFLNLPPKKKSGDYSAILIPEQGQSNAPLIIFKPLMKSSTLVSRKSFFCPICNANVFFIHKFLFWKITIHRMRLIYYSFIEMLIRTKIKEQLIGSHLCIRCIQSGLRKQKAERKSCAHFREMRRNASSS